MHGLRYLPSYSVLPVSAARDESSADRAREEEPVTSDW
jgi:hypothetical protein